MSINAAMAEGPATPGIAIGTMNGSPPPLSPNTPPSPGNTIFTPIRNSTMPPAMLTDSMRNCISLSTVLPQNRITNRVTSAITSSRTST